MNDGRRDPSSASAPPPNRPSPPSAPPVGQDSWLDYIEQRARKARDLEDCLEVIEAYKAATLAEPGSLRIWLAYCEFFWMLYHSSFHPNQPNLARPWPPDEQARAREIFSLDSALHLWQEGHEATRYRLSDSHELWNRWIAKELELLARTKTAEGVKRITHLFRNRLMIPHAAWSETADAFSSFLSEYNQSQWEETMKDITTRSQQAREIYEKRDPYELRLRQAGHDHEAATRALQDYLQFEIKNTIREKKNARIVIQIAMGLFSRALTGLLARDEATWTDYIVFISTLYHRYSSPATRDPDMLQIIPSSFSVLQIAVQHCAWSGQLWARYILSGEEAGLSFSAMERIKHAATDSAQLERNGMVPVIDMYAAWCGYLKRSALDPTASEEMTDVADAGLLAALEAVDVTGKRLFGSAYVGDPDFRIERMLIGYLTEKHSAIDDARAQWLSLASRPLYAKSYNFWVHYYVWELSVFQAEKGKRRSPTPSNPPPARPKTPSLAADVLQRALKVHALDWPERIMEVYIQHCTDYESPETVRLAYDFLHRTRKLVEARRQEEAAAAAAAGHGGGDGNEAAGPTPAGEQAQQAQAQETQHAQASEAGSDARHGSPSGSKRKRGDSPEDSEGANKRIKNGEGGGDSSKDAGGDGTSAASRTDPKRDREHTSVLVTNLPADTTQTRVRQYFRDYGHVNNIIFKRPDQGPVTALIEFRTPDEARSALLRDGKYYEEAVISVRDGAGLTLWVTNFPPTADDGYIRRLFRECGEVFDIRWPSLKANTHRRFCYVSFLDADAARKATALDGTWLDGKYKLQAKLSNPSQRKAREGPTSEGREVKVRNLPEAADENAVKEMFGKYGEIQTVRVVRNMVGKSQGFGFVAYNSKEEAERAVAELNGAKLRNNILGVEVAKATNFKPFARTTAASMSPPPPALNGPGDHNGDVKMGGHNDAASSSSSKEPSSLRTFALLGIPDTVNDSRVRALVEKHCGGSATVTKLVLRPDHGGAIVEMADQTVAGKTQLALEGVEMEGRVLRTGSVAELLAEKPVVRTDRVDAKPPAAKATGGKGASGGNEKPPAAGGAKLMPPSRINAPALGKKLPKRGPGFPKPIAAVNSGGPNGEGTAAKAPPAAPKSNSQFREMFLGKPGEAGAKKDDDKADPDKSSAAVVAGETQNGNE